MVATVTLGWNSEIIACCQLLLCHSQFFALCFTDFRRYLTFSARIRWASAMPCLFW
jgi:hypothetical protein